MTTEEPPEGTFIAAVQTAVGQVERDVGLEPGFLNGIYESENDWAFILKLHALLDSALTVSIMKAIGHQSLDLVIARLPLSGQASKRAFGRALKVLSREEDGLIGVVGTSVALSSA